MREPALLTLGAPLRLLPLGLRELSLYNAPPRTRAPRPSPRRTCQVTNPFPPSRAPSRRLSCLTLIGRSQEGASNQQFLLRNLSPLFPPPPAPHAPLGHLLSL